MQFVLMGYYLIFIYEHCKHKVNTHTYIKFIHTNLVFFFFFLVNQADNIKLNNNHSVTKELSFVKS